MESHEYRGVAIHENFNIPQGFYGRFYVITDEGKHYWMGPGKERCSTRDEAKKFIDKNYHKFNHKQ